MFKSRTRDDGDFESHNTILSIFIKVYIFNKIFKRQKHSNNVFIFSKQKRKCFGVIMDISSNFPLSNLKFVPNL